MPRPNSTQGRTSDLPPRETERRSAAIAAMGYRLAAAGPRTRQRLIDREIAPQIPPEPLRAEPRPNVPMPALASWDDALWEQRLAADAELGMARLSAQPARFPVWRAAALLASAACGFSLVLFGQSLHLDRKLRQANRPTLVAEAQPPATKPSPPPDQHPQNIAASTPPPAQAQPAPVQAVAPALSQPAQAIPPSPAPPPVQAQTLAQAAPAAAETQPPEIRQAALPKEHPAPHPAQPASAALTHQPVSHAPPRPVIAMATRTPEPKWADAKPHPTNRAASPHHDLPRWLTEDRPEHERELIMSPPPHNLEPPLGAQLAANTHPATPKNDPPPIPQPAHRPALIYAEAHNAPPPPTYWAAPRPTYNANPYYTPYPQTYGYYGAMPPPTPYYEP